MKTRIPALVIAIAAIVTLSFTFATVPMEEDQNDNVEKVINSAPVGGIVFDAVVK